MPWERARTSISGHASEQVARSLLLTSDHETKREQTFVDISANFCYFLIFFNSSSSLIPLS